jgi:hypothetical protein
MRRISDNTATIATVHQRRICAQSRISHNWRWRATRKTHLGLRSIVTLLTNLAIALAYFQSTFRRGSDDQRIGLVIPRCALCRRTAVFGTSVRARRRPEPLGPTPVHSFRCGCCNSKTIGIWPSSMAPDRNHGSYKPKHRPKGNASVIWRATYFAVGLVVL